MQRAVILRDKSKREGYALRAQCPTINDECQYEDGIGVRETGITATGAPFSTFTTDTTPMMCLQKQFQGESCA